MVMKNSAAVFYQCPNHHSIDRILFRFVKIPIVLVIFVAAARNVFHLGHAIGLSFVSFALGSFKEIFSLRTEPYHFKRTGVRASHSVVYLLFYAFNVAKMCNLFCTIKGIT